MFVRVILIILASCILVVLLARSCVPGPTRQSCTFLINPTEAELAACGKPAATLVVKEAAAVVERNALPAAPVAPIIKADLPAPVEVKPPPPPPPPAPVTLNLTIINSPPPPPVEKKVEENVTITVEKVVPAPPPVIVTAPPARKPPPPLCEDLYQHGPFGTLIYLGEECPPADD